MDLELNLFWGILLGLIISLVLTRIFMEMANFIGNMVRLCIRKLMNINKSSN